MFDALLERFPVNRIVTILTPPIAAAAGIVFAWLADHLPFIAEQVNQTEITLIFLGTVAAVVTMAREWLIGWRKHEERVEMAALEGLEADEIEAGTTRHTPDDPDAPTPISSKRKRKR